MMTRVMNFLKSVLDPRPYLALFRLVHYYNYTYVAERRKLSMGEGVALAPNLSLANGERIEIGAGSNIGSRCHLWAGDHIGRIVLGEHALLAPDVFITTSDYRFDDGAPIMDQAKNELDVIVGDDVWLGAKVVVVGGVTIGDGCVVAAGAVVTRDLAPYTIAGGVPAEVLGQRAVPGSRRPAT
ncbi:MAG: acyltransferase [Acidimicrobiia bacterium]|nr:acyltransferase [Acidimicrobiia bacterium]MDH5238881.1 acyltransferase [Acidimicrobiia bacterium]